MIQRKEQYHDLLPQFNKEEIVENLSAAGLPVLAAFGSDGRSDEERPLCSLPAKSDCSAHVG